MSDKTEPSECVYALVPKPICRTHFTEFLRQVLLAINN